MNKVDMAIRRSLAKKVRSLHLPMKDEKELREALNKKIHSPDQYYGDLAAKKKSGIIVKERRAREMVVVPDMRIERGRRKRLLTLIEGHKVIPVGVDAIGRTIFKIQVPRKDGGFRDVSSKFVLVGAEKGCYTYQENLDFVEGNIKKGVKVEHVSPNVTVRTMTVESRRKKRLGA